MTAIPKFNTTLNAEVESEKRVLLVTGPDLSWSVVCLTPASRSPALGFDSVNSGSREGSRARGLRTNAPTAQLSAPLSSEGGARSVEKERRPDPGLAV